MLSRASGTDDGQLAIPSIAAATLTLPAQQSPWNDCTAHRPVGERRSDTAVEGRRESAQLSIADVPFPLPDMGMVEGLRDGMKSLSVARSSRGGSRAGSLPGYRGGRAGPHSAYQRTPDAVRAWSGVV